MDPETGDIVPTDGRCKKRSPDFKASDSKSKNIKYMTKAELIEEIIKLRKENDELKSRISNSDT